MSKVRKWLAITGVSAVLFALATVFSGRTAYAETEPTYEVTNETAEAEAYVGEVNTEHLNVRLGFGTAYDRVNVNGEYIMLVQGDEVAVMSSGNAANGDLWYEVRWMKDGTEFHGYVNASFVNLSENRAVPLPTPTPVATPTPAATPTPVVTPTPEVTQAPVLTQAPGTSEKKEGGFSPLAGVSIVAVLLIIAAAVYIIVMKKKREATAAETTEKIDSLKHIQLKKGPEDVNGNPISVMKRKQEVMEEPKEAVRAQFSGYESDAAMLARKEHARMVNEEFMEKSRFFDPNEEKKKEDELKLLSESLKEKDLLREEIDGLNPGDIVYHEYFGKGVVFDNTDVRRIEVRFGTDMRFIDKAGCVSKKLMRKV